MSVQELEEAVTQLSSDEYKQFTAWLANYEAEQWDQQIEADAKAGKLDYLIAKAQRDFEAGRFKEF